MRRGWKVVLAFLLGAVFAELSADFTDWVFFTFYRDVTPESAPLVWYYLTAVWYAVLFSIAYAVSRLGVVRPENFVDVLMVLAVVGGYLSWSTLSRDLPASYLAIVLGIPVAVSFGILLGLRREVA